MDDTSPSPQLTPTSKVKAMLAAVDEDSESEKPGRKRHAIIRKRDAPPKVDMRSQVDILSEPEPAPIDIKDYDADGDGTPIVPRGKLAALLSCQNAQERQSSDGSDTESDKENAYARVKNQLMKKHVKTTSPIGKETDPLALSASSLNAINRATPSAPTIDAPSKTQNTSPTLFAPQAQATRFTARPTASTTHSSSDSDLPDHPQRNKKVLELVARMRAERETKQTKGKEAKKRRKRQGSADELERDNTTSYSDSDSGSEDAEIERRLTQHNRPIRKASKRAIEEMTRETQRLSRNMQLSLQAKTKKKITKESLLARFNFARPAVGLQNKTTNAVQSNTASSVNASDHEDSGQRETPPTSPLQPEESGQPILKQPFVETSMPQDVSKPSMVESLQEDELPGMVDVLRQPQGNIDKGKGKGIAGRDQTTNEQAAKLRKVSTKKIPPKVYLASHSSRSRSRAFDSDSDLEVIPTNRHKGKSKVFSRVPMAKIQDARPLQALRMLAYLNSPQSDKPGKGRPPVSAVDLSLSLQKRARLQAGEERKAKIEELRARGIVIQTTEEKEKGQIEVEDLLEKARKDNQALREKEKRAARKEKLANGETEGLDDSSDDDADYREGDNQQHDIDLSGSEEEDETENSEEERGLLDVEGEVDEQTKSNGFIDDQAPDDSRDEDDIEADDEGEDEEPNDIAQTHPRRRTRFIVDDEDEIEDQDPGDSKTDSKSISCPSLAVEVPKVFQGKQDSISIGMTQAFAATMAETQTQADNDEGREQECPSEPILPVLQVEDSLLIVQDTQSFEPQASSPPVTEAAPANRVSLHNLQSQLDLEMDDTQMEAAATQVSEIPDPTQDAGFMMSSPGPEQRFVSEPPSTIDTVIEPRVPGEESPKPKKRGRLQRRQQSERFGHEEDESFREKVKEVTGNDVADAFAVMKNARKQAIEREIFDKKKSEAKTMVEEQAQESEDEYAGLGGASDDESGGEDNDFDKEMIDHEIVDNQERKLAAFHA